MSPFRRVLVPIDFSDGSRAALRMALEVAKDEAAQIDAVHVVEPSPWMAPTQLVWVEGKEVALRAYLEQKVRQQLDAFIGELAPDDGRVRGRVAAGPARSTILREVEEGDYQLVVMGTHGRTGLSRLFLGSVAEHVVRAARCPVLTVRCPPAEPTPEVGADGSSSGPLP